MNRLIIFLCVMALLVSCSQSQKNENQEADGAKADKIITATIEELLANPLEFEGKEVALNAMVTHVCRHGGQKCFVVAEDGETQLRINVGGEIDEFETSLEGSTVTFKGMFRILTETQTGELLEDYESKSHHTGEMSHTAAEKASYFLEAVEYKEITE